MSSYSMDRWEGRVALVTGASAGIGSAICESLVQQGMKVVGVARRVEKIEELAETLGEEKGILRAMKCDITNEEEVEALFEEIKAEFEGIDVCVNNAGMAVENAILSGEPKEWRQMMDVNVVSVSYFSKLAVESMKEREVDDGHIININSIAGHKTVPINEYNFYASTKHALRALTEGLRQELRAENTKIKVSSISPGLVKTEFFETSSKYNTIFEEQAYLEPKDLADIVINILASPPHVEINDLIVTPVG